jgi:hypothetical protein
LRVSPDHARGAAAALAVVVYPVPVQGEGAAAKIAQMLAIANSRAECDVLLLVRGGGSIEDLWQFNEEAVARAIRAARVPVVVGVGHETDFTIADLAADRRAPTPTAAAMLVAPISRGAASVRSRRVRRARSRRWAGMQRSDSLARQLVHRRTARGRAATRRPWRPARPSSASPGCRRAIAHRAPLCHPVASRCRRRHVSRWPATRARHHRIGHEHVTCALLLAGVSPHLDRRRCSGAATRS